MALSHSPNLEYIFGAYIDHSRSDWFRTIAEITASERHLLSQTEEALRSAAQHNRLLVIVDMAAPGHETGLIVAFCALWPLEVDESNEEWYEFGSVWVASRYRWKNSGITLSDNMYRHMLNQHPRWNILATTTNQRAIEVGQRVGLFRILYDELPTKVRKATCCCPKSKTGFENPDDCGLRDAGCFVRVTAPTYQRLGSPQSPPFPDHPPSSASG